MYTKQQDFTAAASHELRSPLAVIRTAADAAAATPGQHEKYLSIIKDECQRGDSLVKNLLLLASAQQENWGVKKQRFELPTEDAGDFLQLALFFSGIPSDGDLPQEWWRQFSWCSQKAPDYREPRWKRDRLYIDSFELQLLNFRGRLLKESPALRIAAQLDKAERTGGTS